jgi:hypothetical protein
MGWAPRGGIDCGKVAGVEAPLREKASMTKVSCKVILYFRPVCSLVKMDQGFMSGC